MTEYTEQERLILDVLCEHAIDQLEEVIEQWPVENGSYGKFVLRRESQIVENVKSRFYIKKGTLGWGDSMVATKYVYGRIGDALNTNNLEEMSQQLSDLYSELAHNYKVDTGKFIGESK